MDVSETYHAGRECRDRIIKLIEEYEFREEERSLLFFIRAKIIDALTGVEQPYPAKWKDGDFSCEFVIDTMQFCFKYAPENRNYDVAINLQKLLKLIYGVSDAAVLSAVLSLTYEEHDALAIKILENAEAWLDGIKKTEEVMERKGNRL